MNSSSNSSTSRKFKTTGRKSKRKQLDDISEEE